jgi:predicted nucleic acid-binding protein
VSRVVLLDAGPLGLVTNPKGSDESRRCKAWLAELAAAGVQIMVPEGADYEVRRELLRVGRRGGLTRLDNLARSSDYLPVTRVVWHRAAELWARARNEGYATADDSALDCDVILAAQALLVAEDGYEVIVATKNVNHLGRFVDAREWEMITADWSGGTSTS